MRKFILSSFLGCLMLAALPAGAQQYSREVGVPLQAAQAEIKKKNWDAALAQLNTANAAKKKSAFEQYQINELKGYIYYQKRDYAEVARIYEENLNSGQTPPAQVGERVKTLTQIYARQRNDQKTIEYGNRWLKGSGANDPDAYQLIAQAYYQQKDFRNAAKVMQEGINVAAKNGKKVDENWLLLKLNSYYAIKDNKGIADTREQLVRSYPKKEYWENLLDILSRQVEDDRTRLNFYRLMLDLDVLKKPTDYLEMAQMMMDQEFNVPGEAAQVIQKGFDNKVLANIKDRERYQRVLNAAKERAEATRKLLAQKQAEAQAAKTGDADVQLGAMYLSFGQNKEAAEAIERGIKKGGLKHADDAQILLGRAYLKLARKDEAKKAFAAVANDATQARIADLWEIRAQQS